MIKGSQPKSGKYLEKKVLRNAPTPIEGANNWVKINTLLLVIRCPGHIVSISTEE